MATPSWRTRPAAGVGDFSTLVVLAERSDGTALEHADHKSLMAALAANDLHPSLHTVVEVMDPENQEHFHRIPGIEIVSVQDVTEKILAQAVVTPGITEVFVRLLTASADTNEIYIVPVPSAWRGETFQSAYEAAVQSDDDLILLGYRTADGPVGSRLHLNPRTTPSQGSADGGRDHILEDGDELVVLAYEEPSWAP